MKFLIFVVSGAICMANVYALQCYTTDMKALGKGKIETKITDCDSYMGDLQWRLVRGGKIDIKLPTQKKNSRAATGDLMKMQGRRSSISSDDIPVQCFSVNARGGGKQHQIKGCTPKGGCELMKTMFKTALEQSADGVVDTIDCLECGGEWCNSGKSSKAVFGFILVTVIATLFY